MFSFGFGKKAKFTSLETGGEQQDKDAELQQYYVSIRGRLLQMIIDSLDNRNLVRPDNGTPSKHPITLHRIGTTVGGVLINDDSIHPGRPIRTVFDIETHDDTFAEICTHGIGESENHRYRFERDATSGRAVLRTSEQAYLLDTPLAKEGMQMMESIHRRLGALVAPKAVTIG